MNKVEAQTRIARNMAVLQYQVENLNRNGQSISAYCEAAICDALNAITGRVWENVNASSYNFPAIDLIASDRSHGVQATLHVTKAKLDKTINSLKSELKAKPGRLGDLQRVEVVGLTCVTNNDVTSWRTVVGGSGQEVEIRGVALNKVLNLQNLNTSQLGDLDEVLQNLTMTSAFHLNSDAAEVEKIVAYLDRPAIRDAWHVEVNWQDMQSAMRSIRRLLTQGANDLAGEITRPYQTFQPDVARLLKDIITQTESISTIIGGHLQSSGSIEPSSGLLIDGHRLRIQEKVTELAQLTGNPPPRW